MQQLKTYISTDDCRGIARSTTGEVRKFNRHGVIDLFSLVTNEPTFLQGGTMADRVIGRGAAFLLIMSGVAHVFAFTISTPALQLLQQAGVNVEYDTQVPHIINQSGTDICPVEKATAYATNHNEAYQIIKEFLISNNIITPI